MLPHAGLYGRSDRTRSAQKSALQSGLYWLERVEFKFGGRNEERIRKQ